MAERRVPRIRFKGFEEDWEQRKFADLVIRESIIADSRKERPSVEYEDVIAEEGRLNKDLQSKKTKKQGIVFFDTDILYGKLRPYLHNWLMPIFDGVAVGDWWVLRPIEVDRSFLYRIIQTHKFDEIANQSSGSKMPRADWKLVSETEFEISSNQVEQRMVGNCFMLLDSLLSLHQRKLEKLKILKKAMLEKMFPKNGAKVPEIRFSGFADDWEQRKFSELVLIERGGSPRPIDNYITDAPDGLNWVKIGDAPAQGRYIFKTAEKIRPQGLSKTRQVQPGDLILSNSMSFGKPYIMGIHGCIHDGWLLIRDIGAKFDLKFLCHLLGSNQMLKQYRMFASGSTVNNLNKELVGNTTVHIPLIQEQRVIGESLESIDKYISLHQRKLEKLRQMKKSMLERMFV